MHTLSAAERQRLSLKGKIKGVVHRWQQAYAAFPERCLACAACVSVCPERAITLVRSSQNAS